MTGDPGDPGEPRTLQDPLAESLRVVDLATDRGLLVRLMGGMAIRAHAPDWPARTRRVEETRDPGHLLVCRQQSVLQLLA